MAVWINHNGQLLEGADLKISNENRAFNYGDGFFETMRYEKDNCDYWKWHVERIGESARLLKIVLPNDWPLQFAQAINALLERSGLLYTTSRVRLQVYRTGGGLYTPGNNTSEYVISTEEFLPRVESAFEAGFATEPCPGKPSYKGIKSMCALPYVLSAMDRAQNGWDEIILYDHQSRVIEASSSNVWWVKGDRVFTSPLELGCVNGVFRRYLKERLEELEIPFAEGAITTTALLDVDEVFLTNALSGIQPVRFIGERKFGTQLAHYLRETV